MEMASNVTNTHVAKGNHSPIRKKYDLLLALITIIMLALTIFYGFPGSVLK